MLHEGLGCVGLWGDFPEKLQAATGYGVFVYSLPDLKLMGESKVGHHPDWVTGTPDGKRFYVANAGSNSVSVIDVATRKELMQIPVGQVPKRNITAVLP